MRILFLTRYFEPEPLVKGLIFARALVARGHEVEVVTGFPNYPGGCVYDGYRVRPYQKERMDEVTVHRVPLYPDHSRLPSTQSARKSSSQAAGVVVALHPISRADCHGSRVRAAGLPVATRTLCLLHPSPFFEFVHLERGARPVLSDRGTGEEEWAIFGIANVRLRDVTERPEPIECGSNAVGGTSSEPSCDTVWTAPPEYLAPHVSNIVLGHLDIRRFGVVR